MAESKFQLTLGKLSEALIASGLPFAGYTPRPARAGERAHFTEDGVGFFIELSTPPGAAPAQMEALRAIVDGFVFTRRRVRSRADLIAAIEGLTAAQRNKLFVAIAVEYLQNDPAFARKLGIGVEGDEDLQSQTVTGEK